MHGATIKILKNLFDEFSLIWCGHLAIQSHSIFMHFTSQTHTILMWQSCELKEVGALGFNRSVKS